MSTKVALEHRTTYRFDRAIGIGPHVIRLRPAPHTRTPVDAYSLRIRPADHFLNWQQDPFGNYLARVVFPTPADTLDITVGLVADLGVINPFDFFIEPYAEHYPFRYEDGLSRDLQPYLAATDATASPTLARWLDRLVAGSAQGRRSIDLLVELNTAVYSDVAYSVRMEEGVQTPEVTLSRAVGSCRDSAWLLVTALRHFGLAARFVSGYLVQLASDAPGSGGPAEDFTDLHAWAEVYLPGAGWIGLDPTSALFASEGHIPLAATPSPSSAAAITGVTDRSQTTLEFSNTVRRVQEDPRVTRPYTTGQVERLHRLGGRVDERLAAAGLELTMGGEPTFVSVDDMTSPEWTVAADGPDKRRLASGLAARLAEHYGRGGLVQHSQGKWYPGEDRPRWQIALVWRTDGEPLWQDPALLADPHAAPSTAGDDAGALAKVLAQRVATSFGLPAGQAQPCFEDPLAVLVREVRQPDGPRPGADPQQADPVLVAGLDATESTPAAWVLPLAPSWFGEVWASAAWRTRRGRVVLVPGDLPAGMRLPLSSVSWHDPDYSGEESYATAEPPLPEPGEDLRAVVVDPDEVTARSALVVEARDGRVCVFLPPLEQLDRFVELVGLVERCAAAVGTPVVLEGYGPPPDPRVRTLSVTPDPGVIEVNVHPTSSWAELSELTCTLYRLAGEQRLGAETFALDGRHSGTGGGHHLTLGGAEPARSPLLRRPDLLVSMLTFWQHHPSLSYLFSGRFVGSTSQAPRVDEGRPEALYELEIAFDEIAALADDEVRPWTVDRSLRPLLADLTGNPHRSEFCIDKLYSPDTTRGRLGLLELRAFEMPPHPEMALVQALLVRALLVRFAEQPYTAPLVRWGTALHERFLLPHFALADSSDVVADLAAHDLDFDPAWLAPFLEFRFPRIGVTQVPTAGGGSVELELRSAIEPWNVLGEEATSGATARYVDSSTERIQVAVSRFVPQQQLLTCNGRPVPLVATATPGHYVAGVRYRAWKPWSALHPTLEVDAPLHFDLVDRGSRLSLGGATYHVVHPGGRSYQQPPVNASEAEARRARRFEAMGHTTGVIDVEALDAEAGRRTVVSPDYPLTLDLRRRGS
nr:transglutaminase family protein [uncultured Friedmanniella sp.]